MKSLLIILLLFTAPAFAFDQYGPMFKQNGTIVSEADDVTKVTFSNLSVVTLNPGSETDPIAMPVFVSVTSDLNTLEASFLTYTTASNIEHLAFQNHTSTDPHRGIYTNISATGYGDFGRIIVDQGTAGEPALAIGNGNTGFYEVVDDIVSLSIGGSPQHSWQSTQQNGAAGGSYALLSETATATNPVIGISGDANTGAGSAGPDIFSLIAGGNNAFNVYSTFNESVLPLLVGDNLTVAGLQTFTSMTTIFTDYSAINNMNEVFCNATSGEVVFHVESCSGTKGRTGTIKKIDSTSNDCVIDPAGSETIDFESIYALTSQGEAIPYICNKTGNLYIRW